ncbi:tetratricopeptide repeat protein [Geobacter argillaceus]|uniref:YaiO family outer membrane protein n=1 Tax=Geobacter argillaceus TaxID=345631 RepID=A0A562WRS8_9BACT|nr:tetratricopeptide repeat protein [Geobacter argillaceus]TWJ32971.1 YaiO family outer membrane protein [Geobacter argillaceus]
MIMKHWTANLILTAFLILQQTAAAEAIGYEQGLAEVRKAITGKQYIRAERLLNQLRRREPRDQELAAMAARVQLWQGRHQAAILLFRESLAIRPNRQLQTELERVEALDALAPIDRLLAAGRDDEAETRLSDLYQSGSIPYEAGRRLGPLLISRGDMAAARSLYAALTGEFPRDRDFAYRYARLLIRLGEWDKAKNLLDQVPWQEHAEQAELRAELDAISGNRSVSDHTSRTSYGVELTKAEVLVQNGSTAEAEQLLRTLIDNGRNRYEAGHRLGYLYRKRGDNAAARDLYAELRRSYPTDRDFAKLQIAAMLAMGDDRGAERELDAIPGPYDAETTAIRGRLAVRQKRYDEAIAWFNASLAIQEDTGVREELSRLEVAMQLAEADRAAQGKDRAKAEEVWHELFNSGRETYQSGYRLGMAAVARRDYSLARDLFSDLSARYPADSGFRQLRIESLILAGDYEAAQREIAALPPGELAKLKSEREDLLYRVRHNSLKLSAGWYGYTGGYPNEQDYSVTLTQHLKRVTTVATASATTRFNKTDSQIGVDLYLGKGEGARRYGYLSLAASPNASFLPCTRAGGELFQAIGPAEYSLGYFRMDFKDSSANIIVPGASLPLPAGLALNERIYLVTDNGGFSFLTTLLYEPNHRFRASYSVGAGTAPDKLQDKLDTERLFTLTNRFTMEYRPVSAYSCGAEMGHEHRAGQYDKAGATLFCRYWW